MFKSFKNVSTPQARVRRHLEKVQAVVELKARVFMYSDNRHLDGSIVVQEGGDLIKLPSECAPFDAPVEKVVSYLIECGFTPEMVTHETPSAPGWKDTGFVIVSDFNSDKKKRLTDWKESYNG